MRLPDISELKRVIKQYDINPNQLAKEAGVGKGTVSKIFNGKMKPSYEMVRNLWDAFYRIIKVYSKRVEDIMIRQVETADISEPISDVIQKMFPKGFSQLPITSEGLFVGMVTEQSLLKRKPTAKTAGEALGSDYAVLSPEDLAVKARDLIPSCQAIVVIKDSRVVGILTKSDFLSQSLQIEKGSKVGFDSSGFQ